MNKVGYRDLNINKVLIMSDTSTSTVFVSGLSIKTNNKDKIIFLGLVDGMDPDSLKTHNFAIPKSVADRLLDALQKIDEDLNNETTDSEDDLIDSE